MQLQIAALESENKECRAWKIERADQDILDDACQRYGTDWKIKVYHRID